MSQEPLWDELDPGIVDDVRLLWAAGFDPTDSGDGVSKPPEERALDEPHVFVRFDSIEHAVADCMRMQKVLHRAGRTNARIELTWAPGESVFAIVSIDWKVPEGYSEVDDDTDT
jgi:hypothetical protein